MRNRLIIALLLCVGAPVTSPGENSTITEAELVRRTQELFDAVVPGDPTPWKKYYADDCLYHDEKGRSLKKAELVADITPLPKGYSGTIKLRNAESRITADTAVLSYDLDETETIFGQELHARYHEMDTWHKRNGDWQIVAAQAFRYYEDPAVSKAIRRNLPIMQGDMNFRTIHLAGPQSHQTARSCSWSGWMEERCSSFQSPATCSSAKEWKAGFFFVSGWMERSMP